MTQGQNSLGYGVDRNPDQWGLMNIPVQMAMGSFSAWEISSMLTRYLWINLQMVLGNLYHGVHKHHYQPHQLPRPSVMFALPGDELM